MGQGVLPSDLSLLIVDTQLSRDGTTLDLTGPVESGTAFTYTIQLDSFARNDSGNYICTATVRPQQPSTYLTGIGVQSSAIIIINIISGTYACPYNSPHEISLISVYLFQLLPPHWMSKPVSPVPLPQWRSAGVLPLVEMLPSLATGSSMATNRMYLWLQYLRELHWILINTWLVRQCLFVLRQIS